MQLEDGTIIDKLTMIVLAQYAPMATIRIDATGRSGSVSWYEHAVCTLSEHNLWLWDKRTTMTYVRNTVDDRCCSCGGAL